MSASAAVGRCLAVPSRQNGRRTLTAKSPHFVERGACGARQERMRTSWADLGGDTPDEYDARRGLTERDPRKRARRRRDHWYGSPLLHRRRGGRPAPAPLRYLWRPRGCHVHGRSRCEACGDRRQARHGRVGEGLVWRHAWQGWFSGALRAGCRGEGLRAQRRRKGVEHLPDVEHSFSAFCGAELSEGGYAGPPHGDNHSAWP